MLHELQTDVMDALFERSERALLHVEAGALSARQRLGIYRNNLFDSLTSALAAVYPTVERLVGEGFFRYAAHGYIVAHPSRSGNLHEFGAQLPDFLAQFEPARGLPYLADSARLDWAWHRVFHSNALPAANAADLLGRIAALGDELRLQVRLSWQPAAQLIASRFPVLRIWQVNQAPVAAGSDTLVDLDAGGERVLVIARDDGLVLLPLGAAEHALLAALAGGDSLGEAVAAALTVDAEFDVAAAIAHHIANGALIDLQVPG